MKTKHSGAKYSAIVGIGEKLHELEKTTGEKYLRLNRGVPSVTNIDLSEIIPLIDFNSNKIQVYPVNTGLPELKSAINESFFNSKTQVDNLVITAGGMNSLDLIFKTIDVKKVIIPEFFWGAYGNIMKINNVESGTYFSFDELLKNDYEDCAVIFCDPNNPVGNKYDDNMLLKIVEELNSRNVTVIWDSPYRKLFYEEDDTFYAELAKLDNVIIAESFSKSIGLSGQRLGFIHSNNKEFITEIGINILYANNGVNGFAQVLVEKLLSTPQGISAAKKFRKHTIEEMNMNISLLRDRGLLADEFYKDSSPVGIFAIVNKSEEKLLEHKIGSVGLPYFTKTSKEFAKDYSRICIALPHEVFKKYFKEL